MSDVITFTPKQVDEEVDLTFEFLSKLVDGETIVDIVSFAATNLGDVSGSSNITLASEVHDSTKAQVIASGGTNGERYLVTCKVQGSRQPVLELEGILPVRNKP